MNICLVEEYEKKTRRKIYYYVRDNNSLRHISKYSSDIKHKGNLIYNYIPEERLRNNTIYEFSFSNSGSFSLSKHSSSKFLKEGKDRYDERVSYEELENLSFEIGSDELNFLINHIEEYYPLLINDLNTFKERMEMVNISTSERVSDYLKNFNYGLASNLCNWPESARRRSISQTSKRLYKLWVLKKVHESLNIEIIIKPWHILQGSDKPASIFSDIYGDYWSCWIDLKRITTEIPLDYEGPFSTLIKEDLIWKRPDILITKGEYKKAIHVPRFNFMIKCVNSPIEKGFANGLLMNYLIPYNTLFKPKKSIVTSLYPIPEEEKEELIKKDFNIVDNFHPNGTGILNIERFDA